MSEGKESAGFWKSLYLTLIVGRPNHVYAQERRDAFLHEFKEQPEAEMLRIRYRIWTTVVIFVPWVASSAARFALTSTWLSEMAAWIDIYALIAAFVLPNCDHAFVRLVMKRRHLALEKGHPQLAEKLLWFCLPPAQCDSAIGDLNTTFEQRRERFGSRYARWWYRWHTFRSLSPIIDAGVERLIKWGILSAVIDWIRRHL